VYFVCLIPVCKYVYKEVTSAKGVDILKSKDTKKSCFETAQKTNLDVKTQKQALFWVYLKQLFWVSFFENTS